MLGHVGVALRLLTDERVPGFLKDLIVNGAMKLAPNLVAGSYQGRGRPRKIVGPTVNGICEQPPRRDSRVTLSSRADCFGTPLAKVDWRVGDAERQTLLKLANALTDTLAKAGLPSPVLEEWAAGGRVGEVEIIDMAHTLGTTRMSDNPSKGVVDRNCRVHSVSNLFIAGGSIFPTSGHTNPTLMILAFAVRLADLLNNELSKS